MIAGTPDATATDVARRLHMEKSTLSRKLERMRSRGWLETVAPDTGRPSPVRVTPRRRRLRPAHGAWREAQERPARLLGEQGSARSRPPSSAVGALAAPPAGEFGKAVAAEGGRDLGAHVNVQACKAFRFTYGPDAAAIRRAHEKLAFPFDAITEVRRTTGVRIRGAWNARPAPPSGAGAGPDGRFCLFKSLAVRDGGGRTACRAVPFSDAVCEPQEDPR